MSGPTSQKENGKMEPVSASISGEKSQQFPASPADVLRSANETASHMVYL